MELQSIENKIITVREHKLLSTAMWLNYME